MSDPHPIAARILRWCLPEERIDLEGDLKELFHEKVDLKGPILANVILVLEAIGLIPLKLRTYQSIRQRVCV